MDSILSGKRIFIVEDDASNLAIMTTILRQAGATVSFDYWEENVIQKIIAFAPCDIILLDLMYPSKITGYDIFDKLRNLELLRDVPIVAVTAADPDTELKKVHSKGFNGYIPKPVRYASFPNQIAAILNGEEVWLTG